MAAKNVHVQPHDPENTLSLALTQRDLALTVFGNMVLMHLFPELGGFIREFNGKLMEVGLAQEFLPEDPEPPGGGNV
jgi:hypothetical protein